MTPTDVGPVCNVDWGPLITGGQALLAAVTALIGAYSMTLLRRNGYRARRPKEATDDGEAVDV